jgi:hypothetical protein
VIVFFPHRARDRKFDRLAIGLVERIGVGWNIPIHPAIEMFDYTNVDRLFFVVAQLDFKGLIERATVVVRL